MSNRHDYTDSTIVIQNLLGAGSIYVYFRKRLTEQQLAALKDVNGICGVSMVDGAYGASSGRLHYGAGVRCSHAFSFEELAPQIVLVVAEALGIDLAKLDVRLDTTQGKWIADAARALCKQATPRNPFYDGAATLDDMKPGTPLLKVSHTRFTYVDEAVVMSKPAPAPNIGAMCLFPQGDARYNKWFLGDMGVQPYNGGERSLWNDTYVTIVNNATNRRNLVRWLLEQSSSTAEQVAIKIVKQYPDDFTTKVVIEDGKLTAKIS